MPSQPLRSLDNSFIVSLFATSPTLPLLRASLPTSLSRDACCRHAQTARFISRRRQVLLVHEALMSKLSLGVDVYPGNSLVAFYVKLGLIEFSEKVFGGSSTGHRLL
jgi:hypothetical protein